MPQRRSTSTSAAAAEAVAAAAEPPELAPAARCRCERVPAATVAAWNGTSAPSAPRDSARPGLLGAIDGSGPVLDDGDRVGAVAHPERDPQADVGLDLRGDRARRPLGGEDEVDPERAALGRQPHEPAHEVGHLVDQGPQLVDDDDEPRHRLGPARGDRA